MHKISLLLKVDVSFFAQVVRSQVWLHSWDAALEPRPLNVGTQSYQNRRGNLKTKMWLLSGLVQNHNWDAKKRSGKNSKWQKVQLGINGRGLYCMYGCRLTQGIMGELWFYDLQFKCYRPKCKRGSYSATIRLTGSKMYWLLPCNVSDRPIKFNWNVWLIILIYSANRHMTSLAEVKMTFESTLDCICKH